MAALRTLLYLAQLTGVPGCLHHTVLHLMSALRESAGLQTRAVCKNPDKIHKQTRSLLVIGFFLGRQAADG